MASRDRTTYFVFIIAILTPVVGILLILLKNSTSIFDVNFLCSTWNDELFYYKQVESMVKYGEPQGYFGFNESHSLYGNFGAWSPAIVMPYYVIGKIFGWTSFTPIVFNVVILVFAFWCLAYFLKPTLLQQIFISVVWISFELGSRYVFSVTPETMITVLVLLFAVFSLKLYRTNEVIYWILANTVIVLLTLFRGYYAAFGIIILSWILFFKKSKKLFVAEMIIIGISAVLYVLILHFFTAAYFDSLVSTGWLTNPKEFVKLILTGGVESFGYIIQTFKRSASHEAVRGLWYLMYYILGVWFVYAFIKKDKKIYGSLLIVYIVELSAMWLMYNAKEGSRQLMALGIVGIMITVYLSGRWIYTLVVCALLVYSSWLGNETFYREIPKTDYAQIDVIQQANRDMTDLINISDGNPWDNTVIWTLSMHFNDLYAMPSGLGINCCEDSYVMDNIDCISAKYIATCPGEEVDSFIEKHGFTLIYKYGQTNLWIKR